MNWPWSKTYDIPCPDGTIKTIYRDIDKAYPLALKDKKSSVDAQATINKQTAKLKTDYAEKIGGLLFTINEQNQSLMISFRNVYLTFKSDPCSNSDMLRRQTEEFNLAQQRLSEAKLQIAGLIDLAAKFPQNPEQVLKMYERVIEKLGITSPVQLTISAIDENVEAVEKWIGGSTNG